MKTVYTTTYVISAPGPDGTQRTADPNGPHKSFTFYAGRQLVPVELEALKRMVESYGFAVLDYASDEMLIHEDDGFGDEVVRQIEIEIREALGMIPDQASLADPGSVRLNEFEHALRLQQHQIGRLAQSVSDGFANIGAALARLAPKAPESSYALDETPIGTPPPLASPTLTQAPAGFVAAPKGWGVGAAHAGIVSAAQLAPAPQSPHFVETQIQQRPSPTERVGLGVLDLNAYPEHAPVVQGEAALPMNPRARAGGSRTAEMASGSMALSGPAPSGTMFRATGRTDDSGNPVVDVIEPSKVGDSLRSVSARSDIK